MTLDPEILIPEIVVIAVMLLISFPVHEAAHAYAAYRLGDSTARLFGRMTLDPFVHFDPIGGSLMAISVLLGGGIGWAKPTPVNPANLRGRYGDAIVSAAGPLSNLGLAILGGVIFRGVALTRADVSFLYQVLYLFVEINLGLMIFNLLPIPPLDGSKVLYSVLDYRTAMRVRPFLDQYGILLLLFVIVFPVVQGQTILGAVYNDFLFPLTNLLVGLG
ncbi:MAG TPA: site-2 protease family protein [Candidatus Limnocylindrales bacterium]|nr:site-2 protease family protein [Candidatus Limnocylindrales bacterium]